jgi:hypothetical protein
VVGIGYNPCCAVTKGGSLSFTKKPTGMVQKLYATIFVLLFTSAVAVQAQTIWNGPMITFTKAAGADFTQAANQDRITASTWITRGNTQGIFNIAPGGETSYAHNVSPMNTEWATGALSDYASLSYKSWEEWAGGRLNVDDIVGKSAVVHLKTENIYLGITFLAWGIGNGAFSYQRTTAATPLPVKLVNFTATKLQSNIVLNWKTATEENSASFTVERSAGGKQFSAIGTVAAAGNSHSEKPYGFVDAKPLSLNFYRLRTDDKDGTFTYSNIVAYKMSQTLKLQFFPNPATTVLHLQYNAPEQVPAQIIDASGRVVKHFALAGGENAMNVDVADLKAGVYRLKIGAVSQPFLKE